MQKRWSSELADARNTRTMNHWGSVREANVWFLRVLACFSHLFVVVPEKIDPLNQFVYHDLRPTLNRRPHPWGLLITFIELIKNGRYQFWQLVLQNHGVLGMGSPQSSQLGLQLVSVCFKMVE